MKHGSRTLSLCTCCRHYPVQRLGVLFARLAQPCQPSPKGSSGRPAHRPFRGLLGVHSRCGLHTRAVTNSRPANRRLQPFRHLHDCSGCFRLERFAGWVSHPLESAAFHGAHPTRSFIGYLTNGRCRPFAVIGLRPRTREQQMHNAVCHVGAECPRSS